MTQAEYIAALEARCHELEAKVGRLQEGCRNLLAAFPQSGDAAPMRGDETRRQRIKANQPAREAGG